MKQRAKPKGFPLMSVEMAFPSSTAAVFVVCSSIMSSFGLATSVKARMMHAIVTLLALTLATPSRSEIVTRLPADVPVTDGVAVNSICGNCCQEGAYCGTVSEDIVLAGATTPTSNLLVPKGSNMTCVLRARNVFGAVDGGLCVPSLLPRHFPIENLCRAFDKV